jgi:hypothetical protein
MLIRPQRKPLRHAVLNVSDIFWQTGWPFDHRLWIAPQIEVEPRFADLRAGRDRALEVALEVPVVPR